MAVPTIICEQIERLRPVKETKQARDAKYTTHLEAVLLLKLDSNRMVLDYFPPCKHISWVRHRRQQCTKITMREEKKLQLKKSSVLLVSGAIQ